MLTTVTPAAQQLSMANSAAKPPKLAPYPTLVGTAITGQSTIPPTTLANAPSMFGLVAHRGDRLGTGPDEDQSGVFDCLSERSSLR